MRLLVSVRDAAEAREAVVGGADVLDAKEPAAGALGAVPAPVLAAIAAAAPSSVPLSVALGDQRDPAALAAAIRGLPFSRRPAPVYAKFALATTAAAAPALLVAAVAAAEAHPARPRLVAAAYADAPAGVLPAIAVLRAVARTGVHGLLLDTCVKDGRTLLDFVRPEILAAWVAGVRGEGLLCALAGTLGEPQLPILTRLGADLLGVRGAVCRQGREGRVEAARVRGLQQALRAGVAPAAV